MLWRKFETGTPEMLQVSYCCQLYGFLGVVNVLSHTHTHTVKHEDLLEQMLSREQQERLQEEAELNSFAEKVFARKRERVKRLEDLTEKVSWYVECFMQQFPPTLSLSLSLCSRPPT